MDSNKLKQFFPQSPPVDLKLNVSDFACVSLIIRSKEEDYELAFIRRAHNPKDAWSGHIAFPGGRKEDHDRDDLATSIRETFEEVGWSLSENQFIGFLADIQARNKTGVLNFFLRPLAFYVEQGFAQTKLDPHEVDEVFWVSVKYLDDIRNRHPISIPGRGLNLPGIKLPSGDILWGLTYMITQELLLKINQE